MGSGERLMVSILPRGEHESILRINHSAGEHTPGTSSLHSSNKLGNWEKTFGQMSRVIILNRDKLFPTEFRAPSVPHIRFRRMAARLERGSAWLCQEWHQRLTATKIVPMVLLGFQKGLGQVNNRNRLRLDITHQD